MPAILAFSLMASAAEAKTYPFVGTWGVFGDCGDPIVITETHLGDDEIEKIEEEDDWYMLTTREKTGERYKTVLYLDGPVLWMQGITEPETRTTLFSLDRCK